MTPSGNPFDWNTSAGGSRPAHLVVELTDETLRDGLQDPSAVTPPRERQLQLLLLMDRLGIDVVNVGLPGAGPRHLEQVTVLAAEIARRKLAIRPFCAARTLASDILPAVEASQRAGIALGVGTFIGSSPIRKLVQGWDLSEMVRLTESAVRLAVRHGLPVLYVTEDTTRAGPDDLRTLYAAAIQAGASRVCLCDTVGHATPHGVEALVAFVASVVARENPAVRIEWHGHQDRGLALANALAALASGAHAVHATGLGIGERVGNTPMDLLLVNLRLLGWRQGDLSVLPEYVRTVSEACGVPVDGRYPVFGRNAFRTGSGVHADAIHKARHLGLDGLADLVYSAVPASLVGLAQTIDVGPMSGTANVAAWLEEHGLGAGPVGVAAVLARAKASDRVLTDGEILEAVSGEPGGAEPVTVSPGAGETGRRSDP